MDGLWYVNTEATSGFTKHVGDEVLKLTVPAHRPVNRSTLAHILKQARFESSDFWNYSDIRLVYVIKNRYEVWSMSTTTMTQTTTYQVIGLDVEAVRTDFPILQRQVHGRPLVFLDSAASSQKPDSVIQAMDTYYRTLMRMCIGASTR